MREAKIDRPGVSFAVFDGEVSGRPVIGRVAAIGLTDEINDRHFIVVDGIDGKVHYADIGRVRPEAIPSRGMIVSLEGPPQEAAAAGTQDKQRARIRVLSYLNLERLAGTEGLTWLDRELASKSPSFVSDQGFGKDVKSALRNRLQWLTERGMVEPTQDGGIRPTTSSHESIGQS